MTPSTRSARSANCSPIARIFQDSCGSFVWVRERGGHSFIAWVTAVEQDVVRLRPFGSPQTKPLRYARVEHVERLPGEPVAGEGRS
jgi:hypothetical protein